MRNRPLAPLTIRNKIAGVSNTRVPSGLTMDPQKASTFRHPRTGETVNRKSEFGEKCLRILTS